MKVGLITTHFAINFGAVLQAYALQKKINDLGFDCEIINYTPLNSVDGQEVNYSFKSFKSVFFSFLLFSNLKYRKKRVSTISNFKSFIKENCKLSSKAYFSYSELKQNLPYYDIFVCGSDQIWNLNLFEDPAFFLRFEDIYPKSKYIAYAPSIAEELASEQYTKLLDNIKHFDSISLREKQAAVKISSLLNRKIKNVLDPVFLISKDNWTLIEEPLEIYEPYILVYAIAADEKFSKTLSHLRSKLRLKVVDINLRPYNKYSANYSITDLSPGNFIWLMRNADFICTSSFHATAFSIIFNKNFFSVPASNRNSRMINILEHLNLEDRLILKKDTLNDELVLSSIDYTIVEEKLYNLQKISLDFLINSLNN